MQLNKVKLGNYIELYEERNYENEYDESSVRGIATSKNFIDTKANLDGVSLTSYKLVKPQMFAYVPDTSRRGDKISLAYNNSSDTYLVSSISVIFKVKEDKQKELLSDYLYIFFNRPEFDRYARFNSWGSAREPFNWEDMCDVEIELPDIEIQQKYVDIYMGLKQNIEAYESGIEELKNACYAEIEKIKHTEDKESILPYLCERQELNSDNKYDDLVGVGNEGFIVPRGSRDSSTFYKCNIFYPRDFVYNPSVVAKGAIAFNNKFTEPKICTEEYIVFNVIDENILSPEYLFLWLKRKETGRFLEFINIDSVRNRVYFRDLENIYIPLPSIKKQQYIADMFNAYDSRKGICEKLKELIKNICPILIKGSVEEAKKCEVASVG